MSYGVSVAKTRLIYYFCHWGIVHSVISGRLMIGLSRTIQFHSHYYMFGNVMYGDFIHSKQVSMSGEWWYCTIPDSKVRGTNMGPIWGRQDPGGSHAGPMNFVIWDIAASTPWTHSELLVLCDSLHGMETWQISFTKWAEIQNLKLNW